MLFRIKHCFLVLLLFTVHCLLFTVLFACTKGDKDISETLAGKPAPNLSLKDLYEKEITLADMKGKVILLRFWSTRCPSCKEEMPRLESIYKDLKAKGFEILAINVEDTKEKAASFAKEFNLTYPILMDEDQKVAGVYKVFGVPTSFFVDKQGIVRERAFGDMNSKAIENIVLPLLEGKVLTHRIEESKEGHDSQHKH